MSFNIFDIAGSGMTAQRAKMDTIASNIANIHTTRRPDGSKGVYIKKDVSFRKNIFFYACGTISSIGSDVFG